MNIVLWNPEDKEEIKDFVIIVDNGVPKIYRTFWDADSGEPEITKDVIIQIETKINT